MRTKLYLSVISGTILVLSLLISSCSTTKKAAVSCPEFSKGRYFKAAGDHTKNYRRISAFQKGGTKNKMYGSFSGKHNRGNIPSVNKSSDNYQVSQTDQESVSYFDKSDYIETLTASADSTIMLLAVSSFAAEPGNDLVSTQIAGCDTIVLKSGAVIIGKVDEIGQSEIRYRRCDNLTGPVILISKSDISLIKYINGTREVLTYDTPLIPVDNSNYFKRAAYNNTPPKTEGLALAGFIASLTGLFVAGIPLGTLAVVFGGISLGKIARNPVRYKGRGLAIAAIIVGFVDIAGAIIAISMM